MRSVDVSTRQRKTEKKSAARRKEPVEIILLYLCVGTGQPYVFEAAGKVQFSFKNGQTKTMITELLKVVGGEYSLKPSSFYYTDI